MSDMSNNRSYVFINNQKVEIQRGGVSKEKMSRDPNIVSYNSKRKIEASLILPSLTELEGSQ